MPPSLLNYYQKKEGVLMADTAVDGFLQDVWKLFQKTGFNALNADLQWEIFLSAIKDIWKTYSGTNAEHFCRMFLLAMQDYYVKKGKKIPKEDSENITVPDKKAIFNLLLDARNVMEGKADATDAAQKYIHCCPAVQGFSSDILEESVRYADTRKGETTIEKT